MRFALALLVVAGTMRVAMAQPGATVGAVRGAVSDHEGPIVGAVVIATSPALQGEQTAITDVRGSYFLSALPPGVYRLTVYYIDGSSVRENVWVQLGKEVVVNVAVRAATGGGEVITIEGHAPWVDQGSTKLGVTITEDHTRNIPTGRTFAAVVGVAAGAQPDLYGTSLAGTTSPETTYVIDGLVATDPFLGTLSTNLPNEFIAETEVIAGGYNAEYGRSTGGTVNVITKRGGNEFHGAVFAHLSPAALASKAATIQSEGSAIDERTDTGNVYDMGAEVGGPIVIDRLWFHAGFAPRVSKTTTNRIISHQVDDDQDGAPDTDDATGFTIHRQIASTPLRATNRRYFYTGKLTGAVDENHRGELAMFGNPGTSDEVTAFGLLRSPASLMWRRDSGTYNATAKWTSTLAGGATELAGNAGFHRTYERVRDYDDRPQIRYNYDRTLADFADIEAVNLDACDDNASDDAYPLITNCPVNGYAEQGLGVINERRDDRIALAGSITHRVRIVGYHTLEAGIDAELASDSATFRLAGGYSLVRGANTRAGNPGLWRLNETMRVIRNLTPDERANPGSIVLGEGEEVCPDRPAICLLESPVHTSTSASNVGTYVQDSWLVRPDLTLAAGVRWDHQVGHVADNVRGGVTPVGDRIGDRVFTLGNVAPRIGVVHDPTGEGRAKLFGHYGRFYETLPLTASDLYGNVLFTQTVLNTNRRRPGQPGYDPNCNVDHGTPDLAETVRACSDRAPRTGFQSFEFVSPGLRGQYTSEVVLGAEYQVTADWKVGTSFQHRTVPVVIEDVSFDSGNTLFITNPGEDFSAEAADLRARAAELMASSSPDDQQRAATYNTRADWLDAVSSLDKPIRNYDAIQLTATLRPSKHSLLLASYTYSANRGNYPGLFSPDTGQLAPNLNTFFDLPSLMPNRTGVLGLDRPHNLHVDGFYRFAFHDSAMTVGASARAVAGVAYTALAPHPQYGGNESYLLRAGSVGRTPMTGQLDVHLAYSHALSAHSSIEAFIDVFNLFNAQIVTDVDQRYTHDSANQVVGGRLEDLPHVKAVDPLTGQERNETIVRNPNFGNTTARQEPRAIQLGARWTF